MIKGFIIGAFMLLPGVSGGTTAIILGNYDELIDAVSNYQKNFKKNTNTLLTTAIGGVVGVFIMAKLLKGLVSNLHYPMHFLFIGIILGGIPILFREAKITQIKLLDFVYIAVGITITLLISFIPSEVFHFEFQISLQAISYLLMAGVIIAVALVLPGIGVTFMLYVLGIYDRTLTAINTFDLPYLLPLGFAVVVGVLLSAKILDHLLKKYPRQTYLLILGFVLGAVKEVIITASEGGQLKPLNGIVSVMFFMLGLVGVLFTMKYTQKKEATQKSIVS